MIAYLRGIVRHLEGETLVLDAGGVGYDVLLPPIEGRALMARLRGQDMASPPDLAWPAGREAELWIYYHVAERQPRPLLIGFTERGNREFFELLLSVAGIGPLMAARSLVMPVCEMAGAIERRDLRTLSSLPGIGKRKAEQIVASLKGKAMPFALLPAPEVVEAEAHAPADFVADVEAVLASLGHKPAEATRMVEAARKRRPDLADAQSLLEEIWRGESAVS